MAGVGMKALHAAVFVVLALFASPSRALACSCVGDVPLCQSFWQADVVFTGRVLSFDRPDGKKRLSARMARVRVERVWRGQLSGTIDVETGLSSADCGISFHEGRHYVIYAYKTKDGALTTNICSPTKELAKAAADLEYFKTIDAPSTGGRIYGTAHFETKGVGLAAAKDVRILLEDASRSWTAVTDANGGFEFTQLPAGEYTIVMEGAPLGPRKVQLRDARACSLINLWAPRPAKLP